MGKYYNNFKKYSIIGIAFAVYEIFLLWLFIDTLGKSTLVSSILIIGSSTIFKFYIYVYSGMMKKNFLGYIIVLGAFYGTNVVLVWFFVEVLGFWASFSSIFLAIVFFILRFLAYDKLNLLKS